MENNGALIEVLKRAIWREEERISRAEAEISKLQSELLDLGVDGSDIFSSGRGNKMKGGDAH